MGFRRQVDGTRSNEILYSASPIQLLSIGRLTLFLFCFYFYSSIARLSLVRSQFVVRLSVCLLCPVSRFLYTKKRRPTSRLSANRHIIIRSGRITSSHAPKVFFAIALYPRCNFLNTCPHALASST